MQTDRLLQYRTNWKKDGKFKNSKIDIRQKTKDTMADPRNDED